MTRRLLSVAGSVSLLLLAVVPAMAQETNQAVRIREVDTGAFPVVSLTVSVAGQSPAESANFVLTENGRAVPAPAIRPFAEAGQQIGVVLAIDTSGSMKGAPFASAIAAARQFLKSAGDEVSVGVLAFSTGARVVAPITAKRSTALNALDRLTATGETSLYDGVIAAARMFSGQAQRNIILLSDGGDTTSRRSLNDAVAAARRADTAIFSVGLKTPETDVGALKTLSRKTNGSYTAADQEQLTAIYQRILTSLTQQYVITYRSQAARGQQFAVTVTSPQGTDAITVLAPKPLAPSPVPPSPHVKQAEQPGILSSPWAMAVVLFFTFLAAFVVLMMLLGPAAKVRRERELRRRVGVQPMREPGAGAEDRGLSSWLPTLVAAGDRLANAGGFTLALEARLERAGLPLTPGEVVAGCVILGFVGAVVGGLGFQSPVFAAILGLVGGALPFGYLAYAARQRTKRLHEQLPDVLMILASSLRSGHSFLQAIDTVSKEVADPAAKEFSRVVTEIRLGRPIEEALNAMADRVGSEDLKWAILAVNIQREVGGNLAEVLDTVAETVRERDQVRRQVDVLSIEGKLSMYILLGLPIGIGLWIFRFNRDYLSLLFSTTPGLFMIGTAVVLMVVGYIWMRKVVNIDV